MGKYTIGLDFGTNTVRAVLVDVDDGEDISAGVWNYAHGKEGIILADNDPYLARQHPGD
jgi:L-ribulokinase